MNDVRILFLALLEFLFDFFHGISCEFSVILHDVHVVIAWDNVAFNDLIEVIKVISVAFQDELRLEFIALYLFFSQ
jgi:hypothetical protein